MQSTPAEQTLLAALGHRIMTYREAHQLSMQDIQALTGISPTMQSHIERGELTDGPRLLPLIRLATALNISIMDVLHEVDIYVKNTTH